MEKLISFMNDETGNELAIIPDDLAHVCRGENSLTVVTKSGKTYTLDRRGLVIDQFDFEACSSSWPLEE